MERQVAYHIGNYRRWPPRTAEDARSGPRRSPQQHNMYYAEWNAMKCPKCGTPIRQVIIDYTKEQLRSLRGIIDGWLGKTKLTPERQAKMQAGRKKSQKV